MSSRAPARPEPKGMALAAAQPTKVERYRAFSHAMEVIDDPRCKRPIPRFMVDMPWVSDDDPVAERIIANLLSQDDPYEATSEGTTQAGMKLVGVKVTIEDLRVHRSDKPGGWGAYLLCDAFIGDDPDNRAIVTIGAKQAVAILAYAYFMGDLPVQGTFSVVTETGEGNTVLTFIVSNRQVGQPEEPLD